MRTTDPFDAARRASSARTASPGSALARTRLCAEYDGYRERRYRLLADAERVSVAVAGGGTDEPGHLLEVPAHEVWTLIRSVENGAGPDGDDLAGSLVGEAVWDGRDPPVVAAERDGPSVVVLIMPLGDALAAEARRTPAATPATSRQGGAGF